MNSQTPLHKVEGLGSSHSGVTHFWRQRVTAAALVPLSVWFVWAVLGLVGANEPQVLYFLSQPLNAILMAVFIVILLYHMTLGMQVVFDDYVHTNGLKIFAMLLTRALAIAVGAACILALLKIAVPTT